MVLASYCRRSRLGSYSHPTAVIGPVWRTLLFDVPRSSLLTGMNVDTSVSVVGILRSAVRSCPLRDSDDWNRQVVDVHAVVRSVGKVLVWPFILGHTQFEDVYFKRHQAGNRRRRCCQL